MNDPLQRARLLIEQGRLHEAEPFLRQAIGQDPENAHARFLLACALTDKPANYREALQMIESALALRPNEALFHCERASILVLLQRPADGLVAARAAKELDPELLHAYVAEGSALLALGRPREAESVARQALSLDPDCEPASAQLAHALRLQGKKAENAEQIAIMLARNPESAQAHAAAGWSALQAGDAKAGQTHFLEALRLEPHNSYARDGLLEAYRARSPLYRAYLKYCFLTQRLSRTNRWVFILGVLVLAQFGSRILSDVYRPAGIAVVVLYYLFVLWVWVARGVGTLFILSDRYACRALRAGEIAEGVIVGGGVVFGVCLLVFGLVRSAEPALLAGLTLLSAAFPLALVFTNRSQVGRWLFAALGATIYILGILGLLALSGLLPADLAVQCLWWVLGLSLISTWLGNIRQLRHG
jgi:Tfp pilus assembly protein PilF